MDKNVDFLASDIPLVEKNWLPPDFNNLTILRLPLLVAFVVGRPLIQRACTLVEVCRKGFNYRWDKRDHKSFV